MNQLDRHPNRKRILPRTAITQTGFVILCLSAIAIVLLALPQFVLLWRGIDTHGWQGLPNAGITEAVVISAVTTAISSVLTIVFGTPLAYVLSRWRFPGRRLVTVLIELPVVLPPTVAGLALLITFGQKGAVGPLLRSIGISLPFTTAAVIVAQTFISAPFYIRAAQIGFNAVPLEIEDAARVDGAQGWSLFRHVTLPLSRNALGAGLTLSWARSLGEFGATMLFAGSTIGRTQTIPLLVYNILESNIDAALWASLILLGLAFVAMLVSHWLSQRSTLERM